ncbi:hypothetical protein [Microbulbifer hainanensis]|uniref:hypothetical protein n=1 Tax=Microbulbifer hainanensis TaxID=2735675 RepID=UPI0018664C12|nr:hypothetical protein [Microbulbifer hainanensis]
MDIDFAIGLFWFSPLVVWQQCEGVVALESCFARKAVSESDAQRLSNEIFVDVETGNAIRVESH